MCDVHSLSGALDNNCINRALGAGRTSESRSLTQPKRPCHCAIMSVFRCPPPCSREFDSRRGLSAHIKQSPDCHPPELFVDAANFSNLPKWLARRAGVDIDVEDDEEDHLMSVDYQADDPVSFKRKHVNDGGPSKRRRVESMLPKDTLFPHAGFIYQTITSSTFFHQIKANEDPIQPYFPFRSKTEWEMAAWLSESDLSQQKIDDFFKLQYVSPNLSSDSGF